MAHTITAPVVTCSRLRMQTDGDGITTLVCFHGCPLRCKWCINPFTFASDTKVRNMTPTELFDAVKIDGLYFEATGGGVTFGGGEPLLRADFISAFTALCPDGWRFCVETSLNVPLKNVEVAAACIDFFMVDIKDTNEEIYKAYTGQSNGQMLQNLQRLLELVGPERILVRVPLIPEFNTPHHQQRSKNLLEEMGITKFDLFTYRT